MASVVTDLTQVSEQVAKFWKPVFNDELWCQVVLPRLVPTESVPAGMRGDTIYVSEVKNLAGALQDVSACTFESEALSMERVAVPIDKRAYAALKFCDVVELQTALSLQNAQVRQAMARGMADQINGHFYATVSCATDNNGVANLTADELTSLTKQADEKCWPDGDRWLLVDECYKKDLLDSTILTNSDFGAADRPVINGVFTLRRYGWNIIFDYTQPFKDELNGGAAGVALAFTTGFLLHGQGYQNRIKMSDNHGDCEWAVTATIDSVFGVAVGTDGAEKCITTRTGV